jgi:hypothetical protein
MRSTARGEILRSLLVFSPFLAIALAVVAVLIGETANEGLSGGRIAGFVFIGLVTLPLAYQVVQSVRDLFARTVETTGLVEKLWSRNEFLLFRNTYIFVERDVFRIAPEAALEIERGDLVRVVHYPHTSTVETVEKVRNAEAAEANHGAA